MKKTKIKINKALYLGISRLDISKTLMYEFWYNYVKPKYQDKAKLCYIDTDSLKLKVKIFTKILLMMFKNGFTHQTTVKMIKITSSR